MSQMNKKASAAVPRTHGGAPSKFTTAYEQLRRSVLASFLFEGQFYEDGASHAARVKDLSTKVTGAELAALADEARNVHNLRHISLYLAVLLIERRDSAALVRKTVTAVVKRADELCEIVALYWRDGKKPLSKQLKLGLADAFNTFGAYALAKYNRDNAIKLRDVLFLSHPKPKDKVQENVFRQLVENKLPIPDTWETQLSAGKDKRETFERLIKEGALGYLALLRNLRNMDQAGCDTKLVESAIIAAKGSERVLPFRYTAAARHAPAYRNALETAMLTRIDEMQPFDGHTIILVDISGSMFTTLSAKSDLNRADAAATLACMFPGSAQVFTFSNKTVEVKQPRGLRGIENILKSQQHSSTQLAEAVAFANTLPHDRIIVITDEQSTSYRSIPNPVAPLAYMINVAAYQNGVGYGKWTTISGFSENILTYMREVE